MPIRQTTAISTLVGSSVYSVQPIQNDMEDTSVIEAASLCGFQVSIDHRILSASY
jgi:hypothetical protein